MRFGKKEVAEGAVRIADWLNPIVSDPSAPLKTLSFIDSFGPSLMPRTSVHQGLAAGASVLIADMVGRATEAAVQQAIPAGAGFRQRMGVRALVTGAGFGLTKIPQKREEPTPVAALRTVGRLVMAGGVGGMVYDASQSLRDRYPATGPLRPDDPP